MLLRHNRGPIQGLDRDGSRIIGAVRLRPPRLTTGGGREGRRSLSNETGMLFCTLLFMEHAELLRRSLLSVPQDQGQKRMNMGFFFFNK